MHKIVSDNNIINFIEEYSLLEKEIRKKNLNTEGLGKKLETLLCNYPESLWDCCF